MTHLELALYTIHDSSARLDFTVADPEPACDANLFDGGDRVFQLFDVWLDCEQLRS